MPSISCFLLLSSICVQISSTSVRIPWFGFHVQGTPHPLQWIGHPCTQTQARFPGPSDVVNGKNRCSCIFINNLQSFQPCNLISFQFYFYPPSDPLFHLKTINTA